MKKRADAFRSIGETAKMIGVPPHVLRYWETQFPQLKPMKRADGRRYYRPEDVRLVAGLCEILRDDGLTIRGAKKMLAKDRGESVRVRGEKRLAQAGHTREEEVFQDAAPAPKRVEAAPVKEARKMPEPSVTPEGPETLPLFPDLIEKPENNGVDWLPNLLVFTAKLRKTKRLSAASRRKAMQLRDAIAGLY